MSIFIETGTASLSKYGEELCGDNIEVLRSNNSVLCVLADGLGSGVKANILSKMTVKIIGTMVEKGATLEEVVETIGNTLPICQKERDRLFHLHRYSGQGKWRSLCGRIRQPAVFLHS